MRPCRVEITVTVLGHLATARRSDLRLTLGPDALRSHASFLMITDQDHLLTVLWCEIRCPHITVRARNDRLSSCAPQGCVEDEDVI